MNALRFCESCGAEWVPGARFCERCGAPMAVAAALRSTVAPLPPEPEPLPSARPAPVRPAAANAARLGLIALVIAIGAVALVLWPRQSALPPMSAPSDAAVQSESGLGQSAGRPSRAPVTRQDIEALKSALRAAHAVEVASILSSGESSLQQRVAFNDALGLLGQGLYRHHVEDGNSDLETAQAEMREILENLDQSGLGLSEPVIDLGVASVAP